MRISDWSSDVCSSDLLVEVDRPRIGEFGHVEVEALKGFRHHDRFGPLGCRGGEHEGGEQHSHDLRRSLVGQKGREKASGGPFAALRHRINSTEAICRSEEHTSELQSLMRISYAVFCLKKKQNQ